MIITLAGADFSSNNVNLATEQWYTNFAYGAANDGTNIAKADFAGFAYQGANDNYVGKTINAVRMRVAQAGTMTIGVCDATAKTILSSQTITISNPSATEVQVYKLDTPVKITEGQKLVFGAQGDTGLFYYKEAGTATADNGERMWHHVGTSSASAASSAASLTVDAGYVVSE